MSRTSAVTRKTNETDVTISLDLDGSGVTSVSTGVGFFDHLLTALGHHGMFDLVVETTGDLHIDEHHTVEDTALALGAAFADALGDRAGLVRYGDARIAMDEAIGACTIDVGGRAYTVLDLRFVGERIGEMSTQMIPHAIESFARTAGFTLHLDATGRNDHHIAEAAIKAVARALRLAVDVDPRRTGVASTKGTLTTDGAG